MLIQSGVKLFVKFDKTGKRSQNQGEHGLFPMLPNDMRFDKWRCPVNNTLWRDEATKQAGRMVLLFMPRECGGKYIRHPLPSGGGAGKIQDSP